MEIREGAQPRNFMEEPRRFRLDDKLRRTERWSERIARTFDPVLSRQTPSTRITKKGDITKAEIALRRFYTTFTQMG
ncbi:hypothetical protein KPH14_005042 [Odynerus spinipes]|uniref:Uncharacterized protein n=1 Tax=Odynerus spinipes TaxID=1348599 RepID=A0AAD9RN55_9HYME|nr:hypothetical protein KPH14_005042 [Odynerus spinipes]